MSVSCAVRLTLPRSFRGDMVTDVQMVFLVPPRRGEKILYDNMAWIVTDVLHTPPARMRVLAERIRSAADA